MSFVTLRAAVETKLNTLVGGGLPLAVVYDQHTSDVSGFPAATFEPSGNENDFYTSDDNIRSYAFDIYVFQECEKAGRDTAIGILASAVDQIITAFDTDYNLGGACDFCLPVPTAWGEMTGGSGAVKYAHIRLICKKETQVIS